MPDTWIGKFSVLIHAEPFYFFDSRGITGIPALSPFIQFLCDSLRTLRFIFNTKAATFTKILANPRSVSERAAPSQPSNSLTISLSFCKIYTVRCYVNPARVAELVDAPDLGSGVLGRVGSSPSSRTNFFLLYEKIFFSAVSFPCRFFLLF